MANKFKNRSSWHPVLLFSRLVVCLLYLISFIPMRMKQKMAVPLSRLAIIFMPERAKIAKKNIAACFPEYTALEKKQLLQDSFVSTTRGVLEGIHSYWQDVSMYQGNVLIRGQEHLLAARARNKGVFILGGHFTMLDFAIPLYAPVLKNMGVFYRFADNPVFEKMFVRGRFRHGDISKFGKRDIRKMMAHIKAGGEVWYAPDQDFGKSKSDLFVNFFGVDTACISTPSWIASECDTTVLMASQFRHPNGQYEIIFSPIFDGFGKNPQADAERWNAYLESEIKKHPDQYFWIHKRFKTRRQGEPSFY